MRHGRGRNFRPRLQRMAEAMPNGATDSTAPGLGGDMLGEMPQPIGKRGNGAGR